MQTTTNYGLKKPETNEHYNIEDFNGNFDIIDTELKATTDKMGSATNHISDTENPHNVTAAQIGLENVPNVSTNNQAPTYSVATTNETLSSGEKLSVAFGKIAKAVSSLIFHLADTVGHITSTERATWNAKADKTALNSYFPVSGGTINGVATFAGGVGGSEGGEVHFKKPPSNSDFTGDITLDVVTNTVRIFASHSNATRLFVIDFAELKAGENEALHTGNSAKVIISDTAPTDTNALWIS